MNYSSGAGKGIVSSIQDRRLLYYGNHFFGNPSPRQFKYGPAVPPWGKSGVKSLHCILPEQSGGFSSELYQTIETSPGSDIPGRKHAGPRREYLFGSEISSSRDYINLFPRYIVRLENFSQMNID